MTDLNILENSLKSTCSGAFVAVSEFIGNFQFPNLFMVIWRKWVRGKLINLSIIGCDGHMMRYGFVGRMYSQSVSSHDGEVISSCSLYVLTHQFLTQYIAFK